MTRVRDIEIGQSRDGVWVAGAAGRGRVSLIGGTVVRIDVDGHAYEEFAEPLLAPLDHLVETFGRVYLGIDAEGMNSFDARFRYLWTEWIKRNQFALDGVLVLFRSRVVESAVVVINAVTGGEQVEACDDRESFEERLAEAVLRSRGASVEA